MSKNLGETGKRQSGGKESPGSEKPRANSTESHGTPQQRILSLQKALGNQKVQRLLGSTVVRAKSKRGQPQDVLEREADRLAERVMRMPKQEIQPQTEKETKKKEEELIQPKSLADERETPQDSPDLRSEIEALHEGGQPLPESIRIYFEQRLGRNLKQVRLHTDERAAESAQAMNAQAFTAGQHVLFGPGQY